MTAFAILMAVALLVWGLWPVFYPPSREDRIRKAQQKALKRHRKQLEKDHQAAIKAWKRCPIRPSSVCASRRSDT